MFGSIDRILAASDRQIVETCREDGDIGRLIAAARRLIEAALHTNVTRSAVDSADPAFQRYIIGKFRGRPLEELHAIYVDDADGFIAEELIAGGGAGSVNASLRQIVGRGLELGAAGLVLFHNHPSLRPEPSIEDIRSTHRVAGVIAAVGIRLVDHLIVAGQKVSSMKRMGLI